MSSSDGIEDDDRHSVASAGPSYVRASSVLSILSSSSSLTDPEQLEVVASTTTTSNTNNDKAKKKRAPRKSKAKDGTADAQKGKNGIAKEKKQQKQDKVAKSKKPAGSGKKGQQRKADGKAENDGEKEQESQEELSDLDDDEDEEDELIEVNEDGSSKAISIVGQLLRKTPNEPKHRWETAYVYAFVERFTNVQQESPSAPQTIFEFEEALAHGGPAIQPAASDDIWEPSLEPIFLDLVGKIRGADRAAGGTGGPKGGWHAWVPWWINEQRAAGSPDFASHTWNKVAIGLRQDKAAIFEADWERKLLILKALVDFILSNYDPVRNYINEMYGYGIAGNLAKERKDKDEKDSAKGKEKARTSKVEEASAADNHLVISPLGQDAKRRIWYKIDESPRVYVSSKASTVKTTAFVTVSDTIEEIEALLDCLHKAPPAQAESGQASIFTKTKQLQKSKRGGSNSRSPKDSGILREQTLHAKLAEIVEELRSEKSAWSMRVNRYRNRRYNIVKKKERETRQIALARGRANGEFDLPAAYVPTRSSTRLRKGVRKASTDYDDSAADEDLERALRESEREFRSSKRRRAGSDYEEVDYTNMDWNADEGEDEYNDNGDDQDMNGPRRSSRAAVAVTGSNKPSKPFIPGERRSARQKFQVDSRETSPEISRPRARIYRADSADPEDGSDEDEGPVKFGGLEEVWTMGKYRGYYNVDGSFVKAEKGDVPLYKLAKMGLPLPNEPGYKSKGDAAASSPPPPPSATAAEMAVTTNGGHPVDPNESTSLPGSAVPTLEPENGDESRDSPPSSIAEEEDVHSRHSSPDVTAIAATSGSRKPLGADDLPEMDREQGINGHAGQRIAVVVP